MVRAIYTLIFGAMILIGLNSIKPLFIGKRIVEENYFAKASLPNGHYFSTVKSIKGEPIEESWIEIREGVYRRRLIYEGYEYALHTTKKTDAQDYHVVIVYITDPSYRIGSKEVGIGSTKREIKRAYRLSKKITELEENEIGFIDDGVWVVFSFSPDNIVTRISIYYGP